MSYSYIQKKDLFIQRSYSWKKGSYSYKKWVIHTTKMNYSYIIYTKNESFIYIHKNDLIHTKKLFIQKKELFIYKKKFLVIIIYKKVSCTKMLYILQKMSYSYTKKSF